MPFLRGTDKHGEIIFQYRKIVNIQKYNGSYICDVKTIWGENFVGFHHKILSTIHSGIKFFDISSLYKSNGGNAARYYQKFLMLFIHHGVLFENFVTNTEEQRFADKVVYPAFKEVEQLFGVKPLIVPLLPHDKASDKYWYCYSDDVEKEVLRCLENCKR